MKIVIAMAVAVLALAGCATPNGDSKFVMECGANTSTCIMNIADRQSGVSTDGKKIVTDPDNVKVSEGDQTVTTNQDAVIVTDPDNVSVSPSASEDVVGGILRFVGP